MLLSKKDTDNLLELFNDLRVTTKAKEFTDAQYEEINRYQNLIMDWNFKHTPHPTEEKYPEQTDRFREILDEMYQTHLKKNADYSHWNINATGIVGLVTRFWDKTARIMNLVGFDIGTGNYSGSKENMVADEKIEDTFNDAAVYAIIARIYIEGKWGK